MRHPLYNIKRYLKATGDNCERLYKILDEHAATFDFARGSLYKHQAWPGGYLQHVADCMSIARRILNGTRRGYPVPFEWGSVVLVLFLHDIEKPFMQLQFAIAAPEDFRPWTKKERIDFRMGMINRYSIEMTVEERVALKYVEGEGGDYSATERKMNELGALCHAADVLSARLWHSRNIPENILTK